MNMALKVIDSLTQAQRDLTAGEQSEIRSGLGLGSAAVASLAAFATAAQGAKADAALQPGVIPLGTTIPSAQVSGLGSAATTSASAYATAAQGAKADTALQSGALKTVNGQSLVGAGDIVVGGGSVSAAAITDATAAGRAVLTAADNAAQRVALGLGSAALTASTAYATAGQGVKADSALQPGVLPSGTTIPVGQVTGLGSAATTAATAYATAAQGAKADTALQPGFIPRSLCMWCIPGRESAGVAFRDMSINGNHATVEPGNTSAFGVANRMGTVAANAGGLFIYPAGVPVNWLTDSVIMSVAITRATPAAAEVLFSWGAGTSGVNAPGLYFSHRTGGFGRIVFNNGAGTLISASDSLTTFSDAGGTTEYHCVIAYDAPTGSLYIYRNGVLDNVNSGLLTGANTVASGVGVYGPRLGGLGAAIHLGSQAAAVASSFRGWQGYLMAGKGLPINVSQIAAMLAENPSVMLTDNEFRFV